MERNLKFYLKRIDQKVNGKKENLEALDEAIDNLRNFIKANIHNEEVFEEILGAVLESR